MKDKLDDFINLLAKSSLNYHDFLQKANDIEEYFEVKECKVLNPETGKYDRGYELIKRKD